MQAHKIKRLVCFAAALAIFSATAVIHAQMPGGGMTPSMGSTPGAGETGSGQSTGGFQNPDDANSAIAPPFDVDDVLRMHRVGLVDEVIINHLRARYHPLILTDADRDKLKKAGVSDRVIVALEDPYGIGIENVRENMKAADSVAPPVAQTPQQAEKADPNAPRLKTRPPSESSATHADSAAAPAPPAPDPSAPSGDVYVGQSHPSAEPITTAPPSSSSNAPNTPSTSLGEGNTNSGTAGETASLDLSRSPISAVPPAPVMKLVTKPIGPGIYLRHGSGWELVEGEPVSWQHHGNKNVEGAIQRPESITQTYPGGTDFLIITSNHTSAIQYQLVRLKTKEDKRLFKPAPPNGVYTAGGVGDLERFDPQKLGPQSWLVSVRDLPPGEYGFLPPVTEQVHSTTDLASTLFTFHIK